MLESLAERFEEDEYTVWEYKTEYDTDRIAFWQRRGWVCCYTFGGETVLKREFNTRKTPE